MWLGLATRGRIQSLHDGGHAYTTLGTDDDALFFVCCDHASEHIVLARDVNDVSNIGRPRDSLTLAFSSQA